MDIITYIPDLEAFRAEAYEMAQSGNEFFSYDEESKALIYKVAQIPVYYNVDEVRSVCLVRLVTEAEQETFGSLNTVVRLGVCEGNEYIFDEQSSEDIYNDVYDQTPVTVTLSDNTAYEYTPPRMIGVFA